MSLNTVGIDIGTGLVKVAGLSRSGSIYHLRGLNTADIPDNSWGTDELKNIEEIAKVIKSALSGARPFAINGHLAMIALPETVAFSGLFEVPKLPTKQLTQALPFEIAEKLSINVDDYLIDYELLASQTKCQLTKERPSDKVTKKTTDIVAEKGQPKISDPNTTQLVFAVAAKHSLIDSVIELAKQAGLEIAGIDIKPSAIIRSLLPQNDTKIRLIIDLGGGTICLAVAEGNQLRLTSTVPSGIKAMVSDSDTSLANLRQKISPIFDELLHVTKYFENRICPGTKIEEIILCGSGANIPGIDQIFHKETGMTVRLGNPLKSIDVSRIKISDEIGRTYADAIGLAMRGVSHD